MFEKPVVEMSPSFLFQLLSDAFDVRSCSRSSRDFVMHLVLEELVFSFMVGE